MKSLLFTLLLCVTTLFANAQCSVTASFTTSTITRWGYMEILYTNTSSISNMPAGKHKQAFLIDNYGMRLLVNDTTSKYTSTCGGSDSATLIVNIIDSTTSTVYCTDTVTQYFTKQCPPCYTTISKSNVSSNTITFTANTPAGSSGMTYNWNFGDGATATGSPVTHTYTSSNNYTVTVGASNTSANCVDTGVTYVTINTPCYTTISKSTGANGLVMFTANTSAGSSGMVYNWNFGDGTTGTGSPISHTYAANGPYNITLTASKASAGCADMSYTYVYITNKVNPCKTTISKANVPPSGSGTVTFTANTAAGSAGMVYNWNFGDGTTGTGSPVTHTYSATGMYTVKLTSSSASKGCVDSTSTATPINLYNFIGGVIISDSSQYDTFKVWLIQYDSATSNLYAVDSMLTDNFYYNFQNKPAGEYRTKAAQVNNPSSGTVWVPTYHTSSLYWNTATLINHGGNGSQTFSNDIVMQTGTVTSGPGFIGGNVNQGANKGTSNGIEGMLIILRKVNGDFVKAVYTDANGAYSFNNIPTGAYSVYPEDGGYNTTPVNVVLTSTTTTVNGISFERTEKDKAIRPIITGITNIVADKAFEVYPNPANGKVFINWPATATGKAGVSISNVMGSKVFQSTVDIKNGSSELNVSHLQAGHYFITIDNGNIKQTQKLVIER